MWTLAITVGLKVLDWIMDKAKVSAEAKKAFYEWVKVLGEEQKSASIMEWSRKQIEWRKENEWKET